MLKILIADDHEIIRKGIIQILSDEFSDIESGEAPDTSALISMANQKDWDIIISDISMPGGGGLFGIREIRKRKIQIPILIISINIEEEYMLGAIRLGASGYLNKDIAPDEIINAVKRIISGRRYFSPLFHEKLTIDQLSKAGILPHELLDDLELEILFQLAKNTSSMLLPALLSRPAGIINSRIEKIMRILNTNSDAELKNYAIKNELI